MMSALPFFSTAHVVAGYKHGYEFILTNSEAAKVITSLDSLFLRGGRFLSYYDLNRVGREKLASYYLPNIKVKYKTQNTVRISRNMNGNIGMFFPENVMHGGGYFFELNDSTMKAEMVDDQGYPCIVSKKLGNGGLLVVTGLWAFSDDEPMRKLLGVPMLGLNQNNTENLLIKILTEYKNQQNSNSAERFITFTNSDSLTTTTGTENYLTGYLNNFSPVPVFQSINLIDGSSIPPSSITINGKEYYGSGYLLQRLADRSRGFHLETHFTDWPTINQRLVPSLHNPIDSLRITAAFSGQNDTLKEFIEVNADRSDPDRPLFFLGSTNSHSQVTLSVDVKFAGIGEIKHGNYNYQFSVDTTNKNRIVSSMMGYEKLKHSLVFNSTDTSGIVSLAMKNNLVCDYTSLLALEPNDTIHFLTGYIDETGLPVELITFTADTSMNEVILKWVTAAEKNNFGFEIQKKENNGSFTTVGFIEGKGTTSEKTYYSYTDREINAGKITYRLKQIDYNGKFSYSDEIEVSPSLPVNYALYQNYPNPFNPATSIKFEVPEEGRVTLKIFDILGKEVKILVDEVKKPGRYTAYFNGNNLASGVYIYQLKAENFTSSRKMMLVK